MAGISVNLTDVGTNKKYKVTLPGDRPVSQLVQALLYRFKLPIISPDGQMMSYRLQPEGSNMLQESDTLISVGIQDGANILLTYEMEAGQSNFKGVQSC